MNSYLERLTVAEGKIIKLEKKVRDLDKAVHLLLELHKDMTTTIEELYAKVGETKNED